MIDWKIYVIYFLLSGMILHYKLTDILTKTDEDIAKLPEKKRKSYEEIHSMVYTHFGNMNILPFVQIMSLLFGWFLLPYGFISSFLKKIGIKVDNSDK